MMLLFILGLYMNVNSVFMRAGLLITFMGIGILSYFDFSFQEQMVVSLMLYLLCCRVVYLVVLKRPITIWWELSGPDSMKYQVARAFAAFGLLFIIYRAFVGIEKVAG